MAAERANDNPNAVESAKLASWVTVKRTKRMWGQGAYGTRGILALTDQQLVFVSGGQTQWEIDRVKIANLKRPRWALGSYLTFGVDGAFYGVAFGGRGLPSVVSGSDLAIRFGGTAGAGAGALGDAVAVAAMVSTAKRCRQWFELLRANGEGNQMLGDTGTAARGRTSESMGT
jgi:hypothetical protein